MTFVRYCIFASLIMLLLAGCRKDNIDHGPFAIEPKDFLSDKKYEQLVIEICYVDGYAPQQSSLDMLKTFLEARLNKPGGISFVYKSISSPGKSSYDLDALRDVEKDHRTEHTKRKKLTAFIFFADAPYSTGNTLGVAYGTTSSALFEKTIKDNSGGIGQPQENILETTVMQHEFGHLLGLVDNGTSMVTAHAENGHHCNDESCLMYYAVETLDFVGNLMGGEVPPLDSRCIADLQANGGK
jgi:hypothetical protein